MRTRGWRASLLPGTAHRALPNAKLACWGVQPPRHPSDLGRVGEVRTRGLNSGSGQQEDIWLFRPSVQTPSHSSLQTDWLSSGGNRRVHPPCVGNCHLPTGSPPPHGDSETLLTRRKTCSAPREKRKAGGRAKGQNTGFLQKDSRQQLS